MWTQFYLANAHFALNIFGALSMFAVAWLYYDAWLVRKKSREGIRALGFGLLSLSFVIHAVSVENSALISGLLNESIAAGFLFATRFSGYLLVIFSLFLDPIQPKPTLPPDKFTGKPGALAVTGILSASILFFPILAIATGAMYLYRATIGLERHLKAVALSFFMLGAAELLSLRTMVAGTQNIDLYNLVVPYGPLWIVEHLLYLVSFLILTRWVFGYLLKRFETQLFMVFVTSILLIFLLTTISFTSLLVKNLVDENLRQLSTDAQVLTFAIDSKKGEALSDAQVIAQDTRLIDAIKQNQRRDAATLVENYLLTKKQSTFLVVGNTGNVLANGEDLERFGYSLSSDPTVKRALNGEDTSSILVQEGVIAPQVFVRAGTPIKSDNQIIGAVIAGTVVDNALLDGIKKATGLDASLYGGNQLSATTLVTADGITRPIGIREEHAPVKLAVLTHNTPFTGSVDLLNRAYFASYIPLTDVDTTVVGMLSVGKPQTTVLNTAAYAIQLSFVTSALLLVLSVFPAYLISRYLTKQLR